MLYEVKSHQQFNQLINNTNYKAVIVLFTANWCPSCQFIYPDYERLSNQYKDILFLKVDVDKQISIRNQVGIKAMPTFMIYSHGRLANVINGADKQKLSSVLESFASIKNNQFHYQPSQHSQPSQQNFQHYNNNHIHQPNQYNRYPYHQQHQQNQHHHQQQQQHYPIYGHNNQYYNRPNQNYSNYNNNNRNISKQMNKYYH